MPALIELEQAYLKYRKDKDFQKELAHLQKTYIGRPTALYFAKRFTEHIGGAKIYLRERPRSHRRSQDKQCAGTGAPRKKNRQKENHC